MIRDDIIDSLVLSLKDKVGDTKGYVLFVKEEYLPDGIAWIVTCDGKGHELLMSIETLLNNGTHFTTGVLDWASEICRDAVDKFEKCREYKDNPNVWPEINLEEKYGEKQDGEKSLPV